MVIGKLDIRKWAWDGKKMFGPHRIIIKICVFPLYLIGRALIAFAMTCSDFSISSGLRTWRDLE